MSTRFVERPAGVELSADTRTKVSVLLGLFADPAVGDDEFKAASAPYVDSLRGLPEAERLEVSS